MGITFAGLSIVLLQNPFTEIAGLVVGKGDIRTMLCLVVFGIVSLVLAYLTNPSENSFRAYLTEQSFRQHISRLDETCDDSINKPRNTIPRIPSGNSTSTSFGQIAPLDGTFPFHFANRAAVSLRTPKHVFHSFGIFTVAAMIPLPKSSIRDDRDVLLISDSWYIGAFGKWWRGGILETWYQDVISGSKDEESWSSGILSMKSLDIIHDCTGSGSKPNMTPFLNGSPPKLRNRERTYKAIPPRSTTPPPLPKSASLPLHASRVLSTADKPPYMVSHHTQSLQTPTSACSVESSVVGASLQPGSPSTLFDQSPRIALVLEQISSSKASLVDLRAQLHDCQSSSSQTHSSLQEEVNTYRERKRVEDVIKLETKSRTKSLDDCKRSAESTKREAEKKFKSAQSNRDQANDRIQLLDQEIAQLQHQSEKDEQTLQLRNTEDSKAERELLDELDCKRQAIKDAEDLITVLNQRARNLEDQIDDERERLRTRKCELESRKSKLAVTLPYNSLVPQQDLHSWALSQNSPTETSHGILDSITGGHIDTHIPLPFNRLQSSYNSLNAASSTTNHLPAQTQYDRQEQPTMRVVDFGEEVTRPLGILANPLPTSQSLIPSGLITSIDMNESSFISRSFQSDSDPYLEQERLENRNLYPQQSHDSFEAHSTYDSFQDLSSIATERNSSEISVFARGFDNGNITGFTDSAAHWTSSRQLSADSFYGAELSEQPVDSRSWFSNLSKTKSKKGLNPDAKEFSLAKGPINPRPSTHHSLPSFDNLNPNGLGSSVLTSSASTSSSLLRAFAPSPAEREALQRAFSGANASFERLPSLSDVGSIPSSPSHIHALPSPTTSSYGSKLLPSWLQAFPRGRKSLFSPWDDEEPLSRNSANQSFSVEKK